jgi:general secretion pathway protein I
VRRSAQRGFTLLEVLVATAIMGVAVAGVMSGLASATRNTARVIQYDRASMLARARMDALLVDDTLPRSRPIAGRFKTSESGGVEAGWQARIMPFESVAPNPGPGTWIVDRIELEIWWMDGTTRRSFALEGFRRAIIRPEQPNP